jgi:hypothetical protein
MAMSENEKRLRKWAEAAYCHYCMARGFRQVPHRPKPHLRRGWNAVSLQCLNCERVVDVSWDKILDKTKE